MGSLLSKLPALLLGENYSLCHQVIGNKAGSEEEPLGNAGNGSKVTPRFQRTLKKRTAKITIFHCNSIPV